MDYIITQNTNEDPPLRASKNHPPAFIAETPRRVASLLGHQTPERRPAIIQWKVLTFTPHDNWHHLIFSIYKAKAGITMAFHKGWLLADPQSALSGEGPHGRMLRFNCIEEINPAIVSDLIREAIKHQTDM